jgi:hypothetical protein
MHLSAALAPGRLARTAIIALSTKGVPYSPAYSREVPLNPMTFKSNRRCPRCDSYLVEHNLTEKWKRYFECQECFLACYLVREIHRKSRHSHYTVTEYLARGRIPKASC